MGYYIKVVRATEKAFLLPKIDKTARLATYLAMLVVLTNINFPRIADRAFDSKRKEVKTRNESF
jgi:hypothetical protein